MSIFGAALIAIFSTLALLHLYWGVGGFWPGSDAETLSARVAGWKSKRSAGFWPCAMVAGALFAAAAIVFAGQGSVSGLLAWVIYGGYAVMIAVFALRGLAPYATPAFNYARGTPFYDLNRRYYAPLCLAIAAALIADYPTGIARFFAI